MIACARMYAASPAAAAAWRALFGHVAAVSGVPLDVIDHAYPAPLPGLWARDDLACAFMCGWPFARGGFRHQLVAAPVPDAAWSTGAAYRSEFLVAAGSSFQSLADLSGSRFAYNSADSHSGWNMPRAHFGAIAGLRFAGMVGPLTTPRRCVEAVAEGRAELTAVDSYALQLLRRHDPALAARVRTIGASPPSPIPPLVAAPGLPADRVAALRASLAALTAPALLDPLCLRGFALVDPMAYEATMLPADPAGALG